jgi:death on curing protein
MIQYLDVDQVLYLHALHVRERGGARGLRDRGALVAALARPAMTLAGENLYPDVPAQAAALMHALVLNHPFVEGNKPVGSHAAIVFIEANRHAFDATNHDLAAAALAVAAGEMSLETLTTWFRERCRAME